jgi:hypothetical protein
MSTILSVPADFIEAFIQERGTSRIGKTRKELYDAVFKARKDELTELWTKYCENFRVPVGLVITNKIKAYRYFIACEAFADND